MVTAGVRVLRYTFLRETNLRQRVEKQQLAPNQCLNPLRVCAWDTARGNRTMWWISRPARCWHRNWMHC